MTDITTQVEELEGLLKAATVGEWFAFETCITTDVQSDGDFETQTVHHLGEMMTQEDASVVAASMNLAPSLIADWKRLKAENEALRKTEKALSDELDMREIEDCGAETDMLQDRAEIARLKAERDAMAEALKKIAGADMGEGGCYYTNRTNISIARKALESSK